MFTITKVVVAALAVGVIQAIPQPQAAQPSSVSSAPPAPNSTPDIFNDLLTAPTAVKRFQRLLVDGAQKLITGDALRKMIVFPFDPATAPPNGTTGGVAVAAVSLHHLLQATTISPFLSLTPGFSRTSATSPSSPASASALQSAFSTPAASIHRTYTHAPPNSSPWSKAQISNSASCLKTRWSKRARTPKSLAT
jgi:hypothetical protein